MASTTKPISGNDFGTDTGLRLADANFIRNALQNLNTASSTYGITAIGTTQATAVQLGSVLNEIDTATASTGVNLPYSGGKHNTPYQFCLIINNGANAITVYSAQGQTDTINGTAGATGISQAAASTVLYASAKVGAWFAAGSGENANFGALTATTINGNTLTTGTGTVTLQGTNQVYTSPAATDTLVGRASTDTLTNKTLTDFINTDCKRVSAQTDVTSSTTLVSITGLAVPLTAGATYSVHVYLPCTINATPGAKFALNTSDTLTATSISYAGAFYNAGAVSASSVTTTLGNAVASAAAAGTYAIIDGTIVVNAAGTLTVQIAQNTSNATTTSALANGYMLVTRIA